MIRLDISGVADAMESTDGFCACEAPKDIDEMAESMDDVRGICRPCGLSFEPTRGGDAVDRGEGGEELPRGLVSGSGEESFRSWPYDCAFNGEAVMLRRFLTSPSGTYPFVFVDSEARNSVRRSRGDWDCSISAARLGRGDRGEVWESLVVLKAVGVLGLLMLRGDSLLEGDVAVSLTCNGVGPWGACCPVLSLMDGVLALGSSCSIMTPASRLGD